MTEAKTPTLTKHERLAVDGLVPGLMGAFEAQERLIETTIAALDEIKALVVAAFTDSRLAKSNLNAAAHKIEALRASLSHPLPSKED